MWEKGEYCEKASEVGGEGVVEQRGLLDERDELEEEVFEEEQNMTVGNNDTISNFETIFTVAENENFLRNRKNRNTIEIFDDMFDSLDITVIENANNYVEKCKETNPGSNPDVSIGLLECDATAEITLTDTFKETLVDVPSSKIATIAEQEVSCNQCNKKFGSETSLKNHIGKDHQAKSRFGCPECEWTGANRGVVKTHVKKKHK